MIVWRTKNIAIIIYNSYDVHEIWCANDITVYSENNVIIFFHELKFLINFSFKKIPISPFVQLAQFWYSSFSWLFVSYLLWPIFGSPFSPLNKGEGIKLWPNNWFPKVLSLQTFVKENQWHTGMINWNEPNYELNFCCIKDIILL